MNLKSDLHPSCDEEAAQPPVQSLPLASVFTTTHVIFALENHLFHET